MWGGHVTNLFKISAITVLGDPEEAKRELTFSLEKNKIEQSSSSLYSNICNRPVLFQSMTCCFSTVWSFPHHLKSFHETILFSKELSNM